MSIAKIIKDYIVKKAMPDGCVPEGLVDLNQYFRHHKQIKFEFKKKDGLIVAISKDFRYGSIITSGKNLKELDGNIKDAILTAFRIPSSYAKEASIKRVGETSKIYALV